jgi:Ni,Fe-hydrogenase III small subunit
VRITRDFELAARDRRSLVLTAEYALGPDGTQQYVRTTGAPEGGGDSAGEEVRRAIRSVLGRSLAIREVDAGSCNGCELEIIALNNPVHDIERLGIHFVASPRHADMLLVTGPVTRNMELALRKTYAATPDPKVVVAVGACGISGGIFGQNYACLGGVDQVVPVDVYVPGCPPRPQALLHGILLAVGRLGEKRWGGS